MHVPAISSRTHRFLSVLVCVLDRILTSVSTIHIQTVCGNFTKFGDKDKLIKF